MKRELEHFYIDGSYGGNQDWFPTFMMRVGGCGAETACDCCIYLSQRFGLTKIAPEVSGALTKEEYVRFAYEMRPYLSPRMSGIDRLDIFIDGFGKFLRDRGEKRLSMTPLSGEEPFEMARDEIRIRIDASLPVPILILNHRNKALEDYVWHWFLLNGYDETEDDLLVKAVTYSEFNWISLRDLWNTGHKRKGGLILFSLDEKTSEQV